MNTKILKNHLLIFLSFITTSLVSLLQKNIEMSFSSFSSYVLVAILLWVIGVISFVLYIFIRRFDFLKLIKKKMLVSYILVGAIITHILFLLSATLWYTSYYEDFFQLVAGESIRWPKNNKTNTFSVAFSNKKASSSGEEFKSFMEKKWPVSQKSNELFEKNKNKLWKYNIIFSDIFEEHILRKKRTQKNYLSDGQKSFSNLNLHVFDAFLKDFALLDGSQGDKINLMLWQKFWRESLVFAQSRFFIEKNNINAVGPIVTFDRIELGFDEKSNINSELISVTYTGSSQASIKLGDKVPFWNAYIIPQKVDFVVELENKKNKFVRKYLSSLPLLLDKNRKVKFNKVIPANRNKKNGGFISSGGYDAYGTWQSFKNSHISFDPIAIERVFKVNSIDPLVTFFVIEQRYTIVYRFFFWVSLSLLAIFIFLSEKFSGKEVS